MTTLAPFTLATAGATPVSYVFVPYQKAQNGRVVWRSLSQTQQPNLAPQVYIDVSLSKSEANRFKASFHIKFPIPAVVNGVTVPSGENLMATLNVSIPDNQNQVAIEGLLAMIGQSVQTTTSTFRQLCIARDTVM